MAVCDRIGKVIDKKLSDSAASAKQLPLVDEGTKAKEFLDGLSEKTTKADVDAICNVPQGSREKLANAIAEEARLKASDPAKEKTRLNTLATKISSVADRCADLDSRLNAEATGKALASVDSAKQLRAAATTASSFEFKDEPLKGVGSETWRALWDAARAFSLAEAYHEHHFPETGADARCVLCQQKLKPDAADRLKRFDAFVSKETEKKAVEAEAKLAALIDDLNVLETTPLAVTSGLAELKKHDEEFGDDVEKWLIDAELLRKAMAAQLAGEEAEFPPLAASPKQKIQDLVEALRNQSSGTDEAQFKKDLDVATATKKALSGRIAIIDNRSNVDAEIERRRTDAKLTEARKLVATGTVSTKATELAEKHATATVKSRFDNEAKRLVLKRIELKKEGSVKGKQFHKPGLEGLAADDDVRQILSEGEQTALGLAGYFTEAHFDAGKSALVLDDPVTSLDHKRRDIVAGRLAELSKDRQVVVFTHEVAFVRDLIQSAAKAGVELAEAYVSHQGDAPGLVKFKFPWKAKETKAQIGWLRARLAQIKRDRAQMNDDQYAEQAFFWAGRLSEAWEGMVDEEIVGEVIDRGTSAVQIGKFKVLTRITEDDEKQLEASYGFCSTYAPRHRNSSGTNPVAPEIDKLEEELESIDAWFKRVKKYSD